MTTTDQQTRKHRALEEGMARVAERVQIRDVVLVTAKLSRRNARDVGGYTLDIQSGARASVDQLSGLLRVRASLDFVARPRGESQESGMVEVRAAFELTYHITDLSGLEPEHFEAFAQLNGVFNAWPFFREFLQSSVVRMGLPPFTLPVLHLGGIPLSPELQAADE
jgi:hypothetical protein